MEEFKDAVDWERELEECQKKVKRLEEVIEERDIQLEKRNRDYRALDRKYRELFCENKQAVKKTCILNICACVNYIISDK